MRPVDGNWRVVCGHEACVPARVIGFRLIVRFYDCVNAHELDSVLRVQ